MPHNPEETEGYVGAALSSNILRFWEEEDGHWEWEKVIDIEDREHPDWDMPVPGLVTDILLSLDDQYMFFSNWLHGDVRMYDISDTGNPRLVDQCWVGGNFGERQSVGGHDVRGAPQMLQLSRDGRRLYWTTSLFSSWDNQFYPEMGEEGSLMMKADVYPEEGRMELDEEFVVDFGDAPGWPGPRPRDSLARRRLHQRRLAVVDAAHGHPRVARRPGGDRRGGRGGDGYRRHRARKPRRPLRLSVRCLRHLHRAPPRR